MDTLAMEEKNLEIVARSLLSERLANRALPVYGLKLHGRNGAGPSLFPGPPIRFPQSSLKDKLNVFQKHLPPGISARKWERARPGLSSLLFPAPHVFSPPPHGRDLITLSCAMLPNGASYSCLTATACLEPRWLEETEEGWEGSS